MSLDGAKFVCLDEEENKEIGEMHSKVINAKGRKFTVGYYTNCDYILEDTRAKGIHCEINCDAFGRVTINNMSEENPIIVNDHITNVKRPLLNDSYITILDKKFLWKFPKSISSEFEDLTVEQMSTPEKEAGVSKQAPSSCPDFTFHRNVMKRFTVHNFAYCIQSEEENTEEEAGKTGNKLEPEMPKTEKSEIYVSELPQETKRSVTPELGENRNIEFVETPKMNLINCTKNKENASTEKKKKLLSFCHQSDVVITSFSPRETGVRIEKSFTAILKPTTPKSVYSTPKSILSEFNDDDSHDFIDFSTPATSKKAGVSRLAKNSSMHLIDLTTPSRFTNTNRPVSPYLKSALKSSVKKNLLTQTVEKPSGIQKLTTTGKLHSDEQLGVSVIPATPVASSSITQNTQTPSSVESVISVDSVSDASSVIEVSTDADTPSPRITTSVAASSTTQTSTKTPLKTPKKLKTASPRRTPQSLMKRAILTSAKKHIQTTRTPGSRLPVGSSATGLNFTNNSPATPKSAAAASTSKAAMLARRQNLMSSGRRSLSVTTSSSATKASAKLIPKTSTGRRLSMATSTPVSRPSTSMQQLRTAPSRTSTSSLHKVRKSIGNTSLSSHVSKPRKSSIIPNRTSPTGLSAHLVAKARRSLACPTPSTSIRARQQAIATTSFVKGLQSVCKQVEIESKPVILISGDEKPYSALEKSLTFILDENDDDSTKSKELNRTFSSELNKTFSPVKNMDDIKQDSNLNRTFSPVENVDDDSKHENVLNKTFSPAKDTTVKRDLNKTFSPEKEVEAEAEIAETIDVSIDATAEVQPIDAQKDIIDSMSANVIGKHNETKESAADLSKTPANDAEPVMEQVGDDPDVISESFAEVVESSIQENKLAEDKIGQLASISTNVEVNSDTEEPPQEKNTEVVSILSEMCEKAGENIAELTGITNNSTVETVQTVANSESIECEENLLQETEKESVSSAILSDVAKEDEELEHEKCTNENELSEEKNESDVTITASNVSIVSHEQLHTADTTSTFNLDNVDLDANNEKENTGSESQETAELLEEIEYVLNKSDELEQKHMKNTQLIEENISETLSEENVYLETKFDDPIVAPAGKEADKVKETNNGPEENIKKSEEKNNEPEEKTEMDKEKVSVTEESKSIEAEKKIETRSNAKQMCASATQVEDEEKEKEILAKILSNTEGTDAKSEQILDHLPMEKISVKPFVNKEALESDENETEMKENEEGNDAKIMENLKKEDPKTPNLRGVREMLQTPKVIEVKTPQFVGMRNMLRTPKAKKLNGDDFEAEKLEGIQTLLKTPVVNAIQEENEEGGEEEKQKIEEKPQTSSKSSTKSDLRTQITTTPLRRSSRRASMSADEAIANIYTPKSIKTRRVSSSAETTTPSTLTMTPKRITTRRMSAVEIVTSSTLQMTPKRIATRRMSAAESTSPSTLPMTPKRITTRRPSLSLDPEDISLKLTPSAAAKRIKRVTIFEENDENMGAIIEEETKEEEETTSDKIKLDEEGKAFEVTIEKQNILQELAVADKPEKAVTELEALEENNDESEIIEDNICEIISDSKNEEQMEPDIEDVAELKEDEQKNSAAEKESSIMEVEIHEIEDDSLCEIIEDNNDEKKLPTEIEEEGEILDESDYEYGKEISKEVNAEIAESEISTPTTPKTKKSIKLDVSSSSLQTPVMSGVCELLKTPKATDKTPNLAGVRELLRTPKQNADNSNLEGLTELVKTPKTEVKYKKEEILKEEDLPSTSADAAARSAEFLGMREMLKTPKSCSTPRMKGIREMMQTPKLCSTPRLGGIKELMNTIDCSALFKQEITNASVAVENTEGDDGLDQFFKTPRAKNIMIPGLPSSAVIEKNAESIELLPTTEYDLNATNVEMQLEELFKTPVSRRFTERLDDECYDASTEEKADQSQDNNATKCIPAEKDEQNLSAEEAFDKLTGQSSAIQTPVRNVYTRKSKVHSAIQQSPFSASDVISDLPKTDVQEWVDSLEDVDDGCGDPEFIEEQEVSMTSMLEENKNEISSDPLINSAIKNNSNVVETVPDSCVKVFITSNANTTTTSEKMVDVSTLSVSVTDPLVGASALKTIEQRVIEVSEQVTERPTTPIESEMSGINFLDETNESIFSEPLMISDSESENDVSENTKTKKNKVEDTINIDSNKTTAGNNKEEDEDDITIDKDEERGSVEQTETVEKEDFIESLVVSDTDSSDENVGARENYSTENESAAAVQSPGKLKSEFEHFKENAIVLEQRSKTPDIIKVRSRLSRKTLGAHEDLQLTIDFNKEKSKLRTKETTESVTKEENASIASIETIEEIIISDDDEELTEVEKKDEVNRNEEEAKPIEEIIEKTSSQETIESENDVTLTEMKVENISAVEEVINDKIEENIRDAAVATVEEKLPEFIEEQGTESTKNNEKIMDFEEVKSSEENVSKSHDEQISENSNYEKIGVVAICIREKKVSESNTEQSSSIDTSPKNETVKIVAIGEEMVTQSTEKTNLEKIVTNVETASSSKKMTEVCNEATTDEIVSRNIARCDSDKEKLSESNGVKITENSSNETLPTVEITSSDEKMSDSNDETIVTVIAVTSSEEKVFDSCNEEVVQVEIIEKIESSKEVLCHASDDKIEENTPTDENTEISKEVKTVEQKPVESNDEQNIKNNEIMETVEQVTQIEQNLPESCINTSTEVSNSEKTVTDTNDATIEKKIPDCIDAENAENTTNNEQIVEVSDNNDKESIETMTSEVMANEQAKSRFSPVTDKRDRKEDKNQISAASAITKTITLSGQDVESKEEDMANVCEEPSTSVSISNAIITEEHVIDEASKCTYITEEEIKDISTQESTKITKEQINDKPAQISTKITKEEIKDIKPESTELTEDKVQKLMPKRRGSRKTSQSSQCSSNGDDAEPPKRRLLRRKAETPIEEVLEETVEKTPIEDSEKITTIDFEIKIKDSEQIEQVPKKRIRKASEQSGENTDKVYAAHMEIVVEEHKTTAQVDKTAEVNVETVPKKRTRKTSAKSSENPDEVKEDNATNTEEFKKNINQTESKKSSKADTPSSSNAENLKTIDETTLEIPEAHKNAEENVPDISKKRTRKASAKTIEEKSNVETVENKNDLKIVASHGRKDSLSSKTEDLETIDDEVALENEEDCIAELRRTRACKSPTKPHEKAIEETLNMELLENINEAEIHSSNESSSSKVGNLKPIDEATPDNSEVHKNAAENIVDVPKKKTCKASAKSNEKTIEPAENINETEEAETHYSNEPSSSNVGNQQTMASEIAKENIVELPQKRTRKASAKLHEKLIEEILNIEPKEAESQTSNEASSSNIPNLKVIDEATSKEFEIHKIAVDNIAELPRKRTRKASTKLNEKTIEQPDENIDETESVETHNVNDVNQQTMASEIAKVNIALPQKRTRKASEKPRESPIEETSNMETVECANQTESNKLDEHSSSNVDNLKVFDETTTGVHENPEDNVVEIRKKKTRKASAKSNEKSVEEPVEKVNEIEDVESHSLNEASSSNVENLKTIYEAAGYKNIDVPKNAEVNIPELSKKRTRKASEKAVEETANMETIDNTNQPESFTSNEPSSSNAECLPTIDETTKETSEAHKNTKDNLTEVPKKRTRKTSAKSTEMKIEEKFDIETVQSTNETGGTESHKSNEPSSFDIENQQTMAGENVLENDEDNITELPKKRTRKTSAKPYEKTIEETSNIENAGSTNQSESHESNESPSSSNAENMSVIDKNTAEISEAPKTAEDNEEVHKKRTRNISAKSNVNAVEEKSNTETAEIMNVSESYKSNEPPSSSNAENLKDIDEEIALENNEVDKNMEDNVVDISKMDTVENELVSDGSLFQEASSSNSETAETVEITITQSTPESDALKISAEDKPLKTDEVDLKDESKDKSKTVVENIETLEVSKTRKRTRKGSQSSQCSTNEDELPTRRAGRRKAEVTAPPKDIIEESEISEDANAGHVSEVIEIQEMKELAEEEKSADVKVKSTRGKRERKGSQSSQCSTKDVDVLPKRRGGRGKKLKTPIDELREDAQQVESSDIESICDGKELIEVPATLKTDYAPIKEVSTAVEEGLAPIEEVPDSDGAMKNAEALIEKNNDGEVITDTLEEHSKDEDDEVFISDIKKDTDSAPLRKGKATRARRAPARKTARVDEVEHLATEAAIAQVEQIEVKESEENAEVKPIDIAPKRRGGRKKNEEHLEAIEDKSSNDAEQQMNVKENAPEELVQEIETKTTTKRRGGRKAAETVVPAKKRATRKKHEHHDEGNDHSHKTADDEDHAQNTADDEAYAHKTADDEHLIIAKEEEKPTVEPTEIMDEKVKSKNETENIKEETNMEPDTKIEISHDTETKPKARRARKRKESHADDEQQDDAHEPSSKRIAKKALPLETTEMAAQPIATPVAMPRRTRKASALDAATPLHTPTRSVPRRAATAHEHNYDESSDTESHHYVTYKRRSGGESSAHKASSAEKATTSRGRTRKPTAKVQKFLEEERSKAGTPKKRLLLAALDAATTSMSATPATKRGRKASNIETDLAVSGSSTPLLPAAKKRAGRAPRTAQLQQGTEAESHTSSGVEETTTQSSCTEEKEEEATEIVAATVAPPVKGRGRGRKASVIDVDTEADAIVPATSTPTPTTSKRGRTGRRLPSKTTESKDHSSDLEEAPKPKVARRGGRGAAAQKKLAHVDETKTASIATTNIDDMADDEEENESLAHVAEKVAATKRTAAASKDNATATKRGRGGGRKKAIAEDEIDDESTDSVAAATATSTRAHGGRGRKVVRFEPTDAAAITNTTHIVAADDVPAAYDALPTLSATAQPSPPAKRATRTRRK